MVLCDVFWLAVVVARLADRFTIQIYYSYGFVVDLICSAICMKRNWFGMLIMDKYWIKDLCDSDFVFVLFFHFFVLLQAIWSEMMHNVRVLAAFYDFIVVILLHIWTQMENEHKWSIMSFLFCENCDFLLTNNNGR